MFITLRIKMYVIKMLNITPIQHRITQKMITPNLT